MDYFELQIPVAFKLMKILSSALSVAFKYITNFMAETTVAYNVIPLTAMKFLANKVYL